MSTTKPKSDPFQLASVVIDGQYRVDHVVGEGGYGVVYRGYHAALEQPIAIKVLKVPDADDPQLQETILMRFREEAKLLYTLSQASLNIVRSMNFGAVTTPAAVWAPYTILEWLEGKSLEDDLQERRQQGRRGRSLEEAMTLLGPAVSGLDVAHQRRVVHRDVKPANIFLLRDPNGPRVKVLDFGIAKVLGEDGVAGTRSKFASFTWLYGAPEQLDPRVGPISIGTDVYAFALLMTELLTDRTPTGGRDVVELLKAATDPTRRPTPRQLGANVSDAVEAVFRRALAVHPSARFASVKEFWTALDEAKSMRPSVTTSGATRPPAATPPGGSASPFGSGTFTPQVMHAGRPSPPPGWPPPPAYGPPGHTPMNPAQSGAPYVPGYLPTGAPYPGMTGPTAMRGMTPWPGHGGPPRPAGVPPVVIVLIVLGALFTGACSAIVAACS